MSAPVTLRTVPPDSRECSISEYVAYSAPYSLLFNAPSTRLMRWIVADHCAAKGKDHTNAHSNPFGSILFVILFVIGILIILAIPVTVFLLHLFRRKGSFMSNTKASFILLDASLVAAALLLGLLAMMLIWNNEELSHWESISLYERIEEHNRKLVCLLTKDFPNKAPPMDTAEICGALKTVLTHVITNVTDNTIYVWTWKYRMNVNNSLNGDNYTFNDEEALKKAKAFLYNPMDPISILGDPLCDVRDDSQGQDESKKEFINAVTRIIHKLSLELGYMQDNGISQYHSYKTWYSSFSWLAVVTALVIVILCLIIRLMFVMRMRIRDGQSTSSSNKSSSDPLTRAVVVRMPVLCALILAFLGALMAILYIKFLQKCEGALNFVDAIGTEFFLYDDVMRPYGVNLSEVDGAHMVDDTLLLKSLENYNSKIRVLEKIAKETLDIYESIYKPENGFEPKRIAEINRQYRLMCALYANISLENRTEEVMAKLSAEANRLNSQRNVSLFRQRVHTALARVQSRNHKCYDIPLLWEQSQRLLYSNTTGPLQGQWLICALFAILTILVFFATARLSLVLGIVEQSSSSSSRSDGNNGIPGALRSSRLLSPKEPASKPISPKNQLTNTPKDEGAKDFISQTDQLLDNPKSEATKSSPYQVVKTIDIEEALGKDNKSKKDPVKPKNEAKPAAAKAEKRT